ncbi:hypothetical protein IH992_22675 [Candidatus Poribacteria bacterium]|nr:hypothetical protein [Candidatus Poribacteria bacterium]
MTRLQISCFFLGLGFISVCGCAVLKGISAGQEWSSNYSLMQGVEANDPAIIDGDVGTVGQSQYLEGSGDTIRDFNAPSESIVFLPEAKSIHRIVIYSSNLVWFDLWVMDAQSRWEKFQEIKGNKKPVIDLRLNRTLNTTGIKIKVRRTSDDAEMRRKNVERVGGYRIYKGRTRAPAKIAEIELYGFVTKGDKMDDPYGETQN